MTKAELSVIRKRAAAKAVKTKERKRNETIWTYMERQIHNHPCGCPLTKGMSEQQLRKLGAGCAAPYYVCPNLDAYRRIVENPSNAI